MTDHMGYRNVDRVYRNLAGKGKLSKAHGSTYTLDTLAENMVLYMASAAVDHEDTNSLNQNKPYWVYWSGWDAMAEAIGMIPTPEQINEEVERNGGDHIRIVEGRILTARNRLSKKAKFLQQQGCIKLLRPAVSLDPNRRNATWLLMLGDTPEENQEAEDWARRCLRLR